MRFFSLFMLPQVFGEGCLLDEFAKAVHEIVEYVAVGIAALRSKTCMRRRVLRHPLWQWRPRTDSARCRRPHSYRRRLSIRFVGRFKSNGLVAHPIEAQHRQDREQVFGVGRGVRRDLRWHDR